MNKRWSKNYLIWVAATAALTLLFLHIAAFNLDNYYPVSGDDGWIMSASYKLASEGVFGSDMYAGFFNADRHYFIALPVYHLLQAASFKLFGFGVFQARLPNLFSAVLLIWVTSSLAYRHYGRRAALLTTALLVFLNPGLTPSRPYAMLTVFSHTGRYDLAAAALAWTAVWQLDNFLRRPRPRTALGLGILSGLAAMTQFFGGFVLLPAAILFWKRSGKRLLRQGSTYTFTAGFLLVITPYLLYVLAHFEDFTGQSVLKSDRIEFSRPSFFLENVQQEGQRFAAVYRQLEEILNRIAPSQPAADWLLNLGLLSAVLLLVFITWKGRSHLWRSSWIALPCFAGSLALFDQTKAPIYAILLFPGICLALAVIGSAVLQYAWQMERPLPARLSFALPVAAILAALLLTGANSHRKLIQAAQETTSYLAAGQRIEEALAPGAVVLGSEQWWPALHNYPYVALSNLWTQWRVAEEHGRTPDFAEQARSASAEFIIVDMFVRGGIEAHPVRLQRQYQDYLAVCGAVVADWHDESGTRMQVFQVVDRPDC